MPKPHGWSHALDGAILLVALIAGVIAARWADRDFQRIYPSSEAPAGRSVARPEWVWALQRPLQRVQHDGVFAVAALTLGAAVVIARHPRRGRRNEAIRPGVAAVSAAVVVGGLTALQQAISGRRTFGGPPAPSFDLSNALEFRASGAVLGAWALLAVGGLWRPCAGPLDRLGRLLGWSWLGLGGYLIAFALLFG